MHDRASVCCALRSSTSDDGDFSASVFYIFLYICLCFFMFIHYVFSVGPRYLAQGWPLRAHWFLQFCYHDVLICFCGYLITKLLCSSECFLVMIVTFTLEVHCHYSEHWFNVGGSHKLKSSDSEKGPVVGACKHREEPLDSLKDRISWQAE
jgi:hypothetical protein